MNIFILRTFSFLIYRIPYPLKSFLSGIIGFFWALGDKSRGKVIIKNLKHSGINTPNFFDIWKVFRNNLMDLFYLVSLQFMNREKIFSFISDVNFQYFDKALKNKKGVILLSAHLGGVEIAGTYISAKGYPLSTVAEWKGVGEKHYEFYNRLRTRFGTEVFPLEDRRTPFLIKECLMKNRILALISDRNLTGKGILTDFLGGKILFPRGPIHYTLRFGSPVIIGTMLRKGNKYIARLYPPIYPQGENESSILKKIRIYMEKIIRENPYMWYAFQSVWEEE